MNNPRAKKHTRAPTIRKEYEASFPGFLFPERACIKPGRRNYIIYIIRAFFQHGFEQTLGYSSNSICIRPGEELVS